MIRASVGEHRERDEREEQQPPRRAAHRAMEQERRVGWPPRHRPVHVVDREIAHARPARMASTSAWSSGLSTSIAGDGVAHFHRADRKAELATDRATLWSSVRNRSTAPSSNAGPIAASTRQPFLRSCSTARHCSIAGSDAGRAEREQVRAAVAAAAEAKPGALRLRKTREQRPALDYSDGEVGAFGLCRELGDHRRIEQRMIGGRDQHGKSRGAVADQLGDRRGDGPARRTEADARIVRKHGPEVSGSCVEHDHVRHLRTCEQRAQRAQHHRFAADRDQRLVAEHHRTRRAGRPGARPREQERGPAAHASSQETILCPRAPARSPARAARHGRSG